MKTSTLLVATFGSRSRTFVNTSGKMYFVDGQVDLTPSGNGFTATFADGTVLENVVSVSTTSLSDNVIAGCDYVLISSGARKRVISTGKTEAVIADVSSRGGLLKGTRSTTSLDDLLTNAIPCQFASYLGSNTNYDVDFDDDDN